VEVDQFGREVFTMHEWGSVVKRFYGNPELAEQPGVFRSGIRLVPSDGASRPMDLGDATIDNVLNGDSNFVVSESDIAFGLDVGDVRLEWRARLNSEGRVGAFEILPFGALSLLEAESIIHAMLERLAVRYGVATGISLRWDALVVEEVTGGPSLRLFRVGHPIAKIAGPFEFGASLGIVDSFGRMIVEALRSESPIYKVLCYYNVARYYYKLLDGKIRSIKRDKGLKISPRRIIPSEEPFVTLAMDTVGLRYHDLIDDVFRNQYRNAIAHFTVGAVLRPVDASAEDPATIAALVLKKMAFDAVADFRSDLTELFDAGWPPEDFIALLSEVDSGEMRG